MAFRLSYKNLFTIGFVIQFVGFTGLWLSIEAMKRPRLSVKLDTTQLAIRLAAKVNDHIIPATEAKTDAMSHTMLVKAIESTIKENLQTLQDQQAQSLTRSPTNKQDKVAVYKPADDGKPKENAFVHKAEKTIQAALDNGIWTEKGNDALRLLAQHLPEETFFREYLEPIFDAVQQRRLSTEQAAPYY